MTLYIAVNNENKIIGIGSDFDLLVSRVNNSRVYTWNTDDIVADLSDFTELTPYCGLFPLEATLMEVYDKGNVIDLLYG